MKERYFVKVENAELWVEITKECYKSFKESYEVEEDRFQGNLPYIEVSITAKHFKH